MTIHQKNCFSWFNHSHSIKMSPFSIIKYFLGNHKFLYGFLKTKKLIKLKKYFSEAGGMFNNGNGNWCIMGRAFFCRTGHLCVEPCIFVLNRLFLCRPGFFCVERVLWCWIWSWSPVTCEKHVPRDSVDKNRGGRSRFLSLLRPEGHFFQTARETMVKSYYTTRASMIDFFSVFHSNNYEFYCFEMANFGSLHGC